MDNIAPDEAKTIAKAQTMTGVFPSEAAARDAVQRLERAGMPPDRIGFVTQNIRQAREAAGSYSPQGAVVGAIVGVLVVLAFIGWLAGRARVFKQDAAAALEDDVARGNVLVTVVCDTPDGADHTRSILERAGAAEVTSEDSAESV